MEEPMAKLTLDEVLSCAPHELYALHHLSRGKRKVRGDRVALAKAIANGARGRAELASLLSFPLRERKRNARHPVSRSGE